jgi:tRNA modification GTPase
VSRDATCTLVHATAAQPGAIAILQLHGAVELVLAQLTGRADWPVGVRRLAPLGDLDEGLVVRLGPDSAQVMPHGGPRIVQRLTERLRELGARPAPAETLPLRALYPEAADEIEAITLLTLARAASPLAIDALLAQPDRWREFHRRGGTLSRADRARAHRLAHLIRPPVVVVAGAANVGKSTLSNALVGRDLSLALDQPGTTRDYTAGRIDLGGLIVDWHDTPGLRSTDDAIESRAIELATRLIERADCLLAMTDPDHDWPTLPREPDLRVINKVDRLEGAGAGEALRAVGELERRRGPVLRISARSGAGLPALAAAVRERLVPQRDLIDPGVWLFDERLLHRAGRHEHDETDGTVPGST